MTQGPKVGMRGRLPGGLAAPLSSQGLWALWSPQASPSPGDKARQALGAGEATGHWMKGIWEARMQEPQGGQEAGGETWLPPGSPRVRHAPAVPWEVGAEGVPWPGHGKPLAPELPALVDSAHHPQLVPGAELDFLNLILN